MYNNQYIDGMSRYLQLCVISEKRGREHLSPVTSLSEGAKDLTHSSSRHLERSIQAGEIP